MTIQTLGNHAKLRIGALALALAVLSPACGDDKGGTSQTTATSDATTGGSTGAPSTSTDDSSTAGSTTDGDGTTASPTSGGTGGGIKEDCDAAAAASLQADIYSCGCAVEELMYPTVESCLEAIGSDAEDQAKDACACELKATDPSNASVEACRRAKFETFYACLAPLMCSDSSGRQACFDALLDGSCGSISKQSEGQILLQCEKYPPFMCGSGETIPEVWTCDGMSDCMDGSDEKNC